MVSSTRNGSRLTIVARPNQSASWRSNVYVLAALAVPSLGAAIGFAALGAWPILPIAGLELLALGAGLYYACWKLQYRQVVTLDGEQVCIDKGYYAPRRRWQLPRARTGLAITAERHPWEGPGLALHDDTESVSLGEFLSRDDTLALVALLRRELPVDSHSRPGQLSL